MTNSEKNIMNAEAVIETMQGTGYKILIQDITEEIELRRDELESFKIENNNDDFVKGTIAGLRFVIRLPEIYKKILEKQGGE